MRLPPSPPPIPPRLGSSSGSTSESNVTFTTSIAIDPREVIVDRDRRLGEGGFGEVFLGEWNGLTVAIKYFRVSESEHEEMRREAEVLFPIRHPNIITLYGIIDDPKRPALVLEFAEGGSLHNLLHNPSVPRLNLVQKIRIMIDIARGMLRLHQINVMMRDLKPANCLFRADGTCCITDFGLSRKSGGGHLTSDTGTPHYCAPEVHKASSAGSSSALYSNTIDVFSFGICMWEIMVEKIPFSDGRSPVQIALAMMNGERPSIPAGYAYPDPDLENLMRECWNQNPEYRPSFSDILARLQKIRDDLIDRLNGFDGGPIQLPLSKSKPLSSSRSPQVPVQAPQYIPRPGLQPPPPPPPPPLVPPAPPIQQGYPQVQQQVVMGQVPQQYPAQLNGNLGFGYGAQSFGIEASQGPNMYYAPAVPPTDVTVAAIQPTVPNLENPNHNFSSSQPEYYQGPTQPVNYYTHQAAPNLQYNTSRSSVAFSTPLQPPPPPQLQQTQQSMYAEQQHGYVTNYEVSAPPPPPLSTQPPPRQAPPIPGCVFDQQRREQEKAWRSHNQKPKKDGCILL